MATKAEIIQSAYSEIRISGLTVSATPADLSLALCRLEDMMEELAGDTFEIGYQFEDVPDANTETGVERKHRHMMSTNLALRLLADFGKDVPQILGMHASSSMTSSANMVVRDRLKQVHPSSRMPRGSGNRHFNRWRRFNSPPVVVKTDSSNTAMRIGEINDFYEDSTTYLSTHGGEIASFSIDVTSGLQLVKDIDVIADGGFDQPFGFGWEQIGSAQITGSELTMPDVNEGASQAIILVNDVDYTVKIDATILGSINITVGSNTVTFNGNDSESIINSGTANDVQLLSTNILLETVRNIQVLFPYSRIDGQRVNYRVEAVGGSDGRVGSTQKVTTTIVTTTGRVEVRNRIFELTPRS